MCHTVPSGRPPPPTPPSSQPLRTFGSTGHGRGGEPAPPAPGRRPRGRRAGGFPPPGAPGAARTPVPTPLAKAPRPKADRTSLAVLILAVSSGVHSKPSASSVWEVGGVLGGVLG